MNCPSCQTESPDGAKFCPECGTTMPLPNSICPHCSSKLPEGAKFCPGCGAAQSSDPSAALTDVERAQVDDNYLDYIGEDWEDIFSSTPKSKIDTQLTLWEKASASGSWKAQGLLAEAFSYPTSRDDGVKAAEWLEKAIDNSETPENARGGFAATLAEMYRTGNFSANNPVQKDLGLSKYYYAISVMNGYSVRTQLMNEFDLWPEKIECLTIRAEAGNEHSMYQLGEMIETGQGCDADFEKAKAWYQKAADAGDEEAQKKLRQM